MSRQEFHKVRQHLARTFARENDVGSHYLGDRLGFFCWYDGKPQGFIDVDWFQYNYDGPKANTKCPNP